jgi:hypothetical protein
MNYWTCFKRTWAFFWNTPYDIMQPKIDPVKKMMGKETAAFREVIFPFVPVDIALAPRQYKFRSTG